jgi:peptidylprolyl isomerase
MMTVAKEGDKVAVHYTGKGETGEVVDSSEGRDPIEFTIGSGDVLPAFEEAVIGLSGGDKKEISINAEEGYGEYREDLVFKVEKNKFPEEITLEKGVQLELPMAGTMLLVTVKDLDDEFATIDANHPLAGETLHFAIELSKILEG